MEKVLENETVRKRINQSSALRQKRKALESVRKSNSADSELLKSQNGDGLLSPMNEEGFTQANCSTGFASSTEYTTENSLKSEEEGEILSPASPLDYFKFESKNVSLKSLEFESFSVALSEFKPFILSNSPP